ncbi:efflux transporter outer membrane subunit [Thauera chlorobenzoica]|uniref:efflux transporter outer membrane subunit n=1 Tax=Thauera chlorobenzoica TaxID=96773 RepID=UPI00089FD762|nr:efflux transporter outer membrane subunit [Thauera chlorobenzoica]SEF57280.1 efflux transporter, outer membrane factor (OMF) lipoprotein, NodT family [Thauera chlorobenzoica]
MKSNARNLLFRAAAKGLTPRRLRPVALSLSCLLLTACAAVGPEYREPPPVNLGSGWTLPLASEADPAELAHWWSALGDPVLDRLIDTAQAQNLDLRQAMARIEEARALRDRIAGERLPTASAGASVNRRRQSENGPLPIGSIPGLDATQTIYDAGFDATWEVDLFGAKQRALEGASARLQATEIEAQGVRMRIVAEVARTWFTAVGAGYELRTQQATLASLQHTLELVRLRQALGDASAADVDTAYTQWANANALLPDIQTRQRAAVLSLGVLLGTTPERELALLDGPLAPLTLRLLPVGERADILRRRPDVLAAERRLAASTADIGVATAELFPKLSIGIGGGFQALSTGDWFDPSSTRSSILPLVSWRLFDGGRVRAEIRAREATEQQAALAYEQAVLAALGDAERALADYHGGLITLERRGMALNAARASHAHAKTRYTAGDIALVDLLAAERSLYEAESGVVRAHTNASIQLVALYKALGGSWGAPTTPPATSSPKPDPGDASPASFSGDIESLS